MTVDPGLNGSESHWEEQLESLFHSLPLLQITFRKSCFGTVSSVLL